MPVDDYRYGHAPTARELLEKEHVAQSEHFRERVEKDFSEKLKEYKSKQTG